MLDLALKMARRQVSAMVAVAFAVLGGTVLVTGAGVLAESGIRSHLSVDRLGGADVVVAADQSVRPSGDLPLALPERRAIPAALVHQLDRLPGVATAVGDLSFPAALIDSAGEAVPSADPRLAGHGWSSTVLLPDAAIDGTPPSGADDVAVDSASAAEAGARPGDRVRVVVNGQPGTYRISALVSGSAPSGIFFADETAARLADRDEGPRAGTVDLIGLRAEPGAEEALAAAVGERLADDGLVVSTGAARGDARAPDALAARGTLTLIAGSLAGVILLIVGFVVAGAMAVSVNGQRRELALLRAVGATPRQVRRLAASQATVVTVAVLVPGVAAGYLLAGQFRRLLVGLGMVPADLPLTFSPVPAVSAVVLLLAAVQLAARGAAWRASRQPANEAVAESRSEARSPSPVRTRAGVLLMVAAGTMSVVPLLSPTQEGAAVTSLAGICAAIGLALAGPALVRAAGAALAERVPGRVGAPAWLAVANTHGYAQRTAATVTSLAMIVVFVLTYALTLTTVFSATSTEVRDATKAQLTVSGPALGGVSTDVLREVRGAPGVRVAEPVNLTTVIWSHRQLGDVTVESVSALVLTSAASAVLDPGVTAGSLAGLTGDTIAVGEDAARSLDARLGDQVHVRLGDGTPVDARVVAVFDRELGLGPLVLSRDLAAGHTTTDLDQSVLVLTDGTEAAGREVAAVVDSRPGLSLQATNGPPGDLGGVPPETWINLAVVLVLLGYLLLGIANKLLASTTQRRSEISTLRVIGTTPSQVRAMMRWEAALISGAALGTGVLLSVLPLALLGVGFLGRPLPAGPVWLLPVTASVVVSIAFVTTALPTRQALRSSAVDALTQPA